MNARSSRFELTMEGRQVDEALSSIFHTILFHRSLGKFDYTGDGNYSIGTIGYTDVDCEYIDLTYVCCSSSMLNETLRREISTFSDKLRGNASCGMGEISLQFFQKKPATWPFTSECIPWEIWTIRLELISLQTEDERQVCREKVGELLADKIFYITNLINMQEYLPKMPNQLELQDIFDTSYPDVQPYLFKLDYSLSGPSANASVGSTMKKLIKETLQM